MFGQGRKVLPVKVHLPSRDAGGVGVADLTDEDDVGVLTQGRPERVREGGRVGADLALVDQARPLGVHDLDRVLGPGEAVPLVVAGMEPLGEPVPAVTGPMGHRRLVRLAAVADVDQRLDPFRVGTRGEAQFAGGRCGHLVHDRVETIRGIGYQYRGGDA